MPPTYLPCSFVREIRTNTAALALLHQKNAVSLRQALQMLRTCMVPHTEQDVFLLPQPSLMVESEGEDTFQFCFIPSQVLLTKQMWKSRKTGNIFLSPQVPYVASRTIQKKNKTNQERLMNKNNRLSAFLLVISLPQTAVMQKVLKFKSHLSLTSADRLPMQ